MAFTALANKVLILQVDNMTTLEAEKPVKNPLHKQELIVRHAIRATHVIGCNALHASSQNYGPTLRRLRCPSS